MNQFVNEIIFVRLCCAGNFRTESKYRDCGPQNTYIESGGVIKSPVKIDISKILWQKTILWYDRISVDTKQPVMNMRFKMLTSCDIWHQKSFKRIRSKKMSKSVAFG